MMAGFIVTGKLRCWPVKSLLSKMRLPRPWGVCHPYFTNHAHACSDLPLIGIHLHGFRRRRFCRRENARPSRLLDVWRGGWAKACLTGNEGKTPAQRGERADQTCERRIVLRLRGRFERRRACCTERRKRRLSWLNPAVWPVLAASGCGGSSRG
jgi:hypothetical protein